MQENSGRRGGERGNRPCVLIKFIVLRAKPMEFFFFFPDGKRVTLSRAASSAISTGRIIKARFSAAGW